MTKKIKRKAGQHRKNANYANRPQNKRKPQAVRIRTEPWIAAKIGRLIVEERVPAQQAALKCGISRKVFREWWRSDEPEAIAFREKHAEYLKKGGRPVNVGQEIEKVIGAIAAGADVMTAFAARGISKRKARQFLADNPEVRGRVAQSQANLKQGLIQSVNSAALLDWKAAKFLMQTLWPEEFEHALVRQQLAATVDDPQDFAAAIANEMAAMAITHAGDTRMANALAAKRQGELEESIEDFDGDPEEHPTYQSLEALKQVTDAVIDQREADPKCVAGDDEPLLRVTIDADAIDEAAEADDLFDDAEFDEAVDVEAEAVDEAFGQAEQEDDDDVA